MSILQEADSLIHGERQSSYGHVLDEYTRFAGMVNATFAGKISEAFTAEDMLLFMVLLKLNRLSHDITHRDSQVDAAGYIGLIEEAQKKRDTPNDPSPSQP